VKNLITNEEILTENKEEVLSQCLNFLNEFEKTFPGVSPNEDDSVKSLVDLVMGCDSISDSFKLKIALEN
jgi:hypothetical protein